MSKFQIGDTLVSVLGDIFTVESIHVTQEGTIWYYYPAQKLPSMACIEEICRKVTKLDKALK